MANWLARTGWVNIGFSFLAFYYGAWGACILACCFAIVYLMDDEVEGEEKEEEDSEQ